MIAAPPAWLHKLANWLTLRRIRAHAMILAVCLWSAAIADFSTFGLMDRAGNIKFQDFMVFYVAGKLVRQHRPGELFDSQAKARETAAILGRPAPIRLPDVYGPQVGLLFSPLSRTPFLVAASLWVGTSVLAYGLCCRWIWLACSSLHASRGLFLPLLLAFPPFFHFVVRGQLSSMVLLCFVLAFFAFRSGNSRLAGLALGSLIFKPQFLVGVVIVLLCSGAWKSLTGVIAGCIAQLGMAWAYFGTAVMRAYARMLVQLPHMTASLEPGVAPTQMHSLRSFWILIFPWPEVSVVLYVLSSVAVLLVAIRAWRSRGPLPLRFSAMVLAAVLANPHLFVYDLLVLAPVFLLIMDWSVQHRENPWSSGLRPLLYLAFLLPLFGPLTIWTHVQLSVIVFVGLLVVLASVLSEQDMPTSLRESKR